MLISENSTLEKTYIDFLGDLEISEQHCFLGELDSIKFNDTSAALESIFSSSKNIFTI